MYEKNTTKKLVLTAVLGAISAILMILEFPMPLIPPFFKMDFSELPVILGGFIMGPLNGALIAAIKVVLNLLLNGTTTAGIGELANLLYSLGYMFPAVLIYHKIRTKKGAVISLTAGTVITSIISVIMNLAVTFPLYGKLMGIDLPVIVDMCAKVNPYVKDMISLMIFSILPFNLFKYGVTSIIAFLLYKKLSTAVRDFIC
ncbi:MAG: ECF transporter S component [Clostridia bacterium]|nr:ECF transporter S component [Clostridia bacterium]